MHLTLIFDFQLTSTRLIHMPYEMTKMARFRIYELLMRNFADSFNVIFCRFLRGAFFVCPDASCLATIFFCMYAYVASKTPPEEMTAPIKYRSATAQASTPGARFARIFDTHLTYCPEKMRATLAPIPNRGSNNNDVCRRALSESRESRKWTVMFHPVHCTYNTFWLHRLWLLHLQTPKRVAMSRHCPTFRPRRRKGQSSNFVQLPMEHQIQQANVPPPCQQRRADARNHYWDK